MFRNQNTLRKCKNIRTNYVTVSLITRKLLEINVESCYENISNMRELWSNKKSK